VYEAREVVLISSAIDLRSNAPGHIISLRPYLIAITYTLSLGYIADFDSEVDEEDPADHSFDGGDNDDNESYDDDDDDDDVVKYEEDEEDKEHLSLADPSGNDDDDDETMTTVNQGMCVEEIERL
ncbi:hypothetical protein Tco_1108036, partial [Tanacetum coccineum]